jgi:NhaP-type Na+/H+ or K+/H+ antiporter
MTEIKKMGQDILMLLILVFIYYVVLAGIRHYNLGDWSFPLAFLTGCVWSDYKANVKIKDDSK